MLGHKVQLLGGGQDQQQRIPRLISNVGVRVVQVADEQVEDQERLLLRVQVEAVRGAGVEEEVEQGRVQRDFDADLKVVVLFIVFSMSSIKFLT